jgi:HTH-type transcriptional regulator, cell division transcriptional repressor
MRGAEGTTGEDYSDAAATFGDRLAHARETLGLGQGQLAQRLGVSPATLRNWEEDRAEPRANRLQMLAGMLNVSMVWLMSGQGTQPLRPGPDRQGIEVCLQDIRHLRTEHDRIGERLERLERRLRAALD